MATIGGSTVRELIRTLRIAGTTLRIYDMFQTDSMGKSKLGYEFKVGRKMLFQGEDFCCSPCYSVDSLHTAYSLLGFLTLGIHDTDGEYFEDYTKEQLDWAEGYGKREYLSALICNWKEKNR